MQAHHASRPYSHASKSASTPFLILANMPDTDDAAQAASVSSRPTTLGFGKCTEVVKTLVPEEFKDRLTRHWKSLGFASESDFARECLMCAVLGRGEVEKLHLDRIRQAFGNGHAIGTAGVAEQQ